MFDLTYGNMTEELADRLALATGCIDHDEHDPGSTEPWISRLVADFVVARGARTVLETGSFKGATSVWIVDALRRLGGGTFVYCEIDNDRARATLDRVQCRDERLVTYGRAHNAIDFLQTTGMRFDLAFLDDDHTKKHVQRELELLYPKMTPGGLILLHDVHGSCDLQTVVKQWGGIALDFPRLGPAGGLGIIQIPS